MHSYLQAEGIGKRIPHIAPTRKMLVPSMLAAVLCTPKTHGAAFAAPLYVPQSIGVMLYFADTMVSADYDSR